MLHCWWCCTREYTYEGSAHSVSHEDSFRFAYIRHKEKLGLHSRCTYTYRWYLVRQSPSIYDWLLAIILLSSLSSIFTAIYKDGGLASVWLVVRFILLQGFRCSGGYGVAKVIIRKHVYQNLLYHQGSGGGEYSLIIRVLDIIRVQPIGD